MSKPQLGIPNDDWELFSDRIDTIYHCGAWVNSVYSYNQLKPSNVNCNKDLYLYT